MTRDDALAGVAVCCGAAVGIAATVLLVAIARVSEPPAPEFAPFAEEADAWVVDYAINRYEVEVMAGPEGPHSGWVPPASPWPR